MFYVGTSGWYYKHWGGGVFYPRGMTSAKWLGFYAGVFTCVELNVTFYRLVGEATFDGWRRKTPEGFHFVAKGSRYISHNKKISGVEEPLETFFKRAGILGRKLAACLWQFSPKFKKDIAHLESFLRLLRKTGMRQVFEFRHPGWFDDEVYGLLRRYNACLCIAHSPGRFPMYAEPTADFAYLRFHGGEKLYGSGYSERELREWARFAKGLKVKDLFAFFNNDAHGFAVRNAIRFRELLGT